jgi:hypothetical protein
MFSRWTHPKNTSPEFIPLHIFPFEENGVWFARAEEFQIVGHGESATEAARKVYNMVLRAVFVAASEGRLSAILKHAGIKVRIGVPQANADEGQKGLWFLPLTQGADHLSVPR